MSDIDDNLRHADPMLNRAAPATALNELGDRLAALAAQAPEPTLHPQDRDAVRAARRRRRRRARVLTGAAGLALLAAAPAAAYYNGLHTGHMGLDEHHYGEFLNLASPQALSLLRQFERDYPLPQGGTWTAMEHRWQASATGVGQIGVFEEAAGLESQYQWERAWLTANATGDRAASARAARVLAQVSRWHVTVATRTPPTASPPTISRSRTRRRRADAGPSNRTSP